MKPKTTNNIITVISAVLYCLLLLPPAAFPQGRIVLDNNTYIVIDNSAYLVIDNPNPNAITVTGTGGNIVSESETDVLKWNIGTDTGTYTIPFTTDPSGTNIKIPLTVQITDSGTGAGSLILSTYQTTGGTGNDNLPYPSGVTNMGIPDSSLLVVDRFWQINATGYSVKPTATLSFSYDDSPNEIGPANTIDETKLHAQRYNTLLNTWNDWGIANVADSILNTVSSVIVPPGELYPFWSLLSCEPDVNLGNDTAFCQGDSLLLDAKNPGSSYLWQDASTAGTFSVTISGTYYVEVTSPLGCTSSDTIVVTVNPVFSVAASDTICQGDSVLLPDGSYTGSAGIYYDTLTTVAGCDSIIETTVTVNPTYSISDPSVAICLGDSVSIYGTFQSITGTYYDSLTTANGCDSIHSTILTINPTYSISDPSVAICQGDSASIYGIFQNSAGTYYDSLITSSGCDSIHSTVLTVNPTYSISDPAIDICQGDSVSIYGTFQSTSGTYYDSLTTANGCDSVHSTVLTVNPAYNISDPAVILCTGDSVSIYGTFQSVNGTYYDSSLTTNGCDSVHSTVLTVISAYNISDPAITLCQGDSVSIYGTFQSSTGTYYDSLITSGGCDSIHSTVLTVNPTYSISDPAIDICQGDSVSIYGTFQSTSGTYYDSLTTANGCDSVHSTVLTVNPVFFVPASASICQGDSVLLPGGSYASSAGVYNDTVTTIAGCDSIIETTVTVSPNADAGTVSGTTPLCIGGTTTYTTTGSGGSWSSTNTAVATVDAGTGVVTAVSAGTSDITYTVSSGCGSPVSAFQTLTVDPDVDAGMVSGATPLCIGGTATYTTTGSGGSWSSTNTAVASVVAGTGVVTAIAAGTSDITYTVSSGCGSPVSAFQTLTVSPNADAGTVSGTTPLCISGTATYTTTGSGGSWSSTNTAVATVNASTGVVTAVSAGTSDITYTVSSGCGSPVSASVTVTVNPLPVIIAMPDSAAIILGESVNLSVSGGISYNWTPAAGLDNPNSSNPIATPTETTLYYVSGSDANTCSNTDSVFISVSEEFAIDVPNIFSPNNDLQNDVLLISSKGVKSIQFIIYDRLGEKVFESNDVNTGWDGTYRGKEMDPGVFVYYLEVEFTNGDLVTKQGNVTLVR